MIEWFKFFGLSFFSNKHARCAGHYGVGSILLTLLLAIVFFYFGYCSGAAPFVKNYENAVEYKQFLHSAFNETDLYVEIENGKAKCDKKINTHTGDDIYAKNGYNLIVDTRPLNMFIKFSCVAVKEETEISYETYLALNPDDKMDYTLKTVYTDEELVISEELLRNCEDYLKKISVEESADYNAHAAKEYKTLIDGIADYSKEEYNSLVYKLYIKYYYQFAKTGYSGSDAPMLRDYYFTNIYTSKYFCLLENSCTGAFVTDNGREIEFGGYCNKLDEGRIIDIDRFIKTLYYKSAWNNFSVNFIFVAIWRFLAWTVLTTLVIGLVMWIIDKFINNVEENKFGKCYKIVCSFVWFSAFLASIIGVVGCWFIDSNTMYAYMLWIYTAILFLRTVIFFCINIIENKKQAET